MIVMSATTITDWSATFPIYIVELSFPLMCSSLLVVPYLLDACEDAQNR